MKSDNIFMILLSSLNVKYTKNFVSEIVRKNPYKNTLLGISKMLFEYGIENEGVRFFEKKEALSVLTIPFLAQVDENLAVVNEISDQKVVYNLNGYINEISIDEFVDKWTGVTLIIKVSSNTREPHYKQNKIGSLFDFFKIKVFFLAIVSSFFILYFKQKLFINTSLSLLLMINLIGCFITTLMVLKQLDIQMRITERICSLSKKKGCDDVLESSASKIFGVVSWSEIGLGYFVSNVFLLLLFPYLVFCLALINVFTLLYTVWSLWYQKVKVKKWCMLCLLVQLQLVCLFIVDYIYSYIQFSQFRFVDFFQVGSIYIFLCLSIHFFLTNVQTKQKLKQHKVVLDSYRLKKNVFEALLNSQPYYPINKSTSLIQFGNKSAKTLVTVFSNPHCEPCGREHEKIKKLLDVMGDKICLQYILGNFNMDVFKMSSKFLISAYLSNDIEKARQIFDVWFEKEKYYLYKTYDSYPVDMNKQEVIDEEQRHLKWYNENKMSQTPTIFINGFLLPEIYDVEELKYLL